MNNLNAKVGNKIVPPHHHDFWRTRSVNSQAVAQLRGVIRNMPMNDSYINSCLSFLKK